MTDKLAPDFYSADFWRSLHYFNLYRLALACFFVITAVVFGDLLSLNERNWTLFFVTSLLYTGAAAGSLILLKFRYPRFVVQLTLQVIWDITGLSVLSYASGGIESSISLLLLVSLAAAGIISRGKITLFFAALATVATLLEHSYAVLHDGADAAQYMRAGILCASYFAVAWLAHTLAKSAVASQKLAQRRGRDLLSLAEANRLVMRDMQDGVLVIDEQGIITQMNQGAERLLRQNIEPGSSLSEAFPILFGQYAIWKKTGDISRDTLQLGMGVQTKLRFVSIERNAAHGAVIFLEDMQRVRAEAQQIKLAALGRLTANIAHEVRNPLSAISYATELLQEEPLDEKQQRLLKIVLDNTQRINHIVQDVMQLNRRDRAQPEVFDLNIMLNNLIEELSLAEHLDPGTLVLTGKPGGDVSFDRDHLRQVLWNLCCNALRHGCSKQPGSLQLIMGMENECVILDVQDDGPGISDELQGKLFEPFFTTAPEGTGLGLYIARELCEANGALLEYHETKERTGACFRITFGKPHKDAGEQKHDR